MLYQAWLNSTDRMDSTIGLRMRHLIRLAHRVTLTTVTQRELEDVLVLRRHQESETRKSVLSSWRLFFGWAQKRAIRPDNPAADIESVKVRVRMPRLAPDDDLQLALLTASDRDRGLISLARFACLRLSELTCLHMRHREGDRLRVLGKGDKERFVGINDDLMPALLTLERTQGAGFYFPGGTGGHLHPMSVNKIITRVTGWNPHSLRHAGATAAWNETHDLRAVQEMLGHASLATTERYLHLDETARRRVAAATAFKPRERIAA